MVKHKNGGGMFYLKQSLSQKYIFNYYKTSQKQIFLLQKQFLFFRISRNVLVFRPERASQHQ